MKYFIRTNEAETGPLTEQEIIDRIKYGGLTADDLACPEGESGFKPISVLFSRFLEPTPPPFPSVSEAISPDVKAPSPQQRVSGQQGALLDTLSGWAKPPGNVQQANPVLLADLAVKKENVYFFFVALIAAVCWLLIIVSLIGIFYGLLISFFIWLGNGLLVAHLKSESVMVGPDQLPKLYKTYREVTDQLQIRDVPPLYVLQSHGMLNAFASRHSGRNFVVIFSDMLEACGESSPQIRFILGHELGHIRRNHILKKMLLAPGLLAPLIGPAYCRACECSCDRHGAFVSGDFHGSAQALMILSGGRNAWRDMNPDTFAHQYRNNRGFFVSWHELTSGYPTLSQRVHNLITLDDFKRQPAKAPRNPLAYLFAMFSLGGGSHGGGGNLIFTVAVIALMAAIAVPGFLRARKRAEVTMVLNNLRLIDAAKDQYCIQFNKKEVSPTAQDLTRYFKPESQLFKAATHSRSATTINDERLTGVTYHINSSEDLPSVDTRGAFADVVDEQFWSPYMAK